MVLKVAVPGYRALVIGATGAIGAAFCKAFDGDLACDRVVALSRQSVPALLLEDEASIAAAAAAIAVYGPFHTIVDATGALTLDGHGPEKSLRALNADQLLRQYQVNAVGPALVFKHFSPLLDSQTWSVYAKLSARVGSISDNRKGGWYGYRAAKAALNMLLQTGAIELARSHPHAVVVALQPGTVASSLSAPFVGATDALQPQDAVDGMLAAMVGLSPKAGAYFVDWRGETIAW
jgi:NAD(P)-dependent dehydrogenase (short-subunit alcohol dehydrogenase family)